MLLRRLEFCLPIIQPGGDYSSSRTVHCTANRTSTETLISSSPVSTGTSAAPTAIGAAAARKTGRGAALPSLIEMILPSATLADLASCAALSCASLIAAARAYC